MKVSIESQNTTASQGKKFNDLIKDLEIDISPCICSDNLADNVIKLTNNSYIKLLSPSIEQVKELLSQIKQSGNFPKDNNGENSYESLSNDVIKELAEKKYVEETENKANISSIAFIFEYKEYKILFMGDAVSSQVVKVLKSMNYSETNKLHLNYCKISHHGSKYNTSNDLIKLLDCSNYIISSNWSNRPNKECLSRIIYNSEKGVCFHCNYPRKNIFTEEELDYYNITFNPQSSKDKRGLELEVE